MVAKMTKIEITISAELKMLMEANPQIKWDAVAAATFEQILDNEEAWMGRWDTPDELKIVIPKDILTGNK